MAPTDHTPPDTDPTLEPELGPADDHLAELLFAGDGSSSGTYTPHRTTLSLAGLDAVTDHVVYLHEVHHGGLNDSTAWGSALHLYARLPDPYRQDFLPLLDQCRLPHEAYATFAGVSVAAARHQSAAAALARFPRYVPLYQRLSSLVEAAGGPHRRYITATAIARLTMQTPILEQIEARNLRISPADVRAIDTPNGRWRWLQTDGAAVVRAAAADADAAITEEHGNAALLADSPGGDPYAAASDEFDQIWERWERIVYEALAQHVRAAGATPLEFNGHLEPTAAVIQRAYAIEPRLGLTAQLRVPARDDRTLAAAVSDHVRVAYGERWKAAALTVDLDELVNVVEETSRIDDQPSLIVNIRLPHRLSELYHWKEMATEALSAQTLPVVAVRVIGDGGGDESVILHSVLSTPDELENLVSLWGERGPVISILAASCLIDRSWQKQWVSRLRAIGPSIVLIDIELERFVHSWGEPEVIVQAGLVEVNDTAGGRWALALSASNQPQLWLALTDEITARLLLEQLSRTTGIQLAHGTAHITAWNNVLSIALTHLLATESFFDFAALEGLA